jgi:hypothetical protein
VLKRPLDLVAVAVADGFRGGFGSGTHIGFGDGGTHFGGGRFACGGFRGSLIGQNHNLLKGSQEPPIRSLIAPNGDLITTSVGVGVWIDLG